MSNDKPDSGQPAEADTRLAPRALSIDLEVGIRDRRIHKLAAVRGDTGEALVASGQREVGAALDRLDGFAEGLDSLLGHNLIAFDAPHLAAARPGLKLLQLPRVDTLRLNPLAFPRNPYHRLVKHYQDGRIQGGQINNPELDARLALAVFGDQWQALREMQDADPRLLLAWHWLTTQDHHQAGVGSFFATIRKAVRPSDEQALATIAGYLEDRACSTHVRGVLALAETHGWALAYALAWISVSGGNSVIPPWVLHQFPMTGDMVRRLRDTPCGDPGCPWCAAHHDPARELKRWFGFPDFREEPVDEDGQPLQKTIVAAAMRGEHTLGILPTGAGKSLCYQIPALSRFDKTGALTVVISPLVALMADQIASMEARGMGCCATINGLLSMPERADALDRVRLGDVGIVLIAPEQLRSRSVRGVLAQREIGAWVLDEAHCLSKWGHDFRPDYRYVGRFIRERAGEGAIPPLLCLTATAKPEVIDDILGHFRHKLGLEVRVLDGGTNRSNLDFMVVPTDQQHKLPHIHQVLTQEMPEAVAGGAIVYCATRRHTEEVAQYLRNMDMAAEHFHAGLPPETKQDVQNRFIRGDLRVIAATNAFGMGIDKPDVRLVLHADIPGSLENYLQEAGRAGRDQQPAQCVLMQTTDDVEKQFAMSARSRLTRREIEAVLRSLRRLSIRKHDDAEIVATAGEILAEDEREAFVRDRATDDTRVRTAVAWLEEAALLSREENRVQVFPSSLRVQSIDKASEILERKIASADYRRQLHRLVQALMDADPDEGLSTDELMAEAGLSPEGVRRALYDLEALGIASNDTALTAFVHVGIERSSHKRLEQTIALETALIDEMVEHAPGLSAGEASTLHLRHANQRLKDLGHSQSLPGKLHRLLKSLSADGRSEDGGIGSLALRSYDAETVQLVLQREWRALRTTAELRRDAAACLLNHLLSRIPKATQGRDLLAETTLGDLLAAVKNDVGLHARVKDAGKLVDHALLWLHEQEVIRLHKGLTVFRPAMTIQLTREKRPFNKSDFEPLSIHYSNQILQIHIMAEYAQRGLDKMADALQLAMDYFRMQHEAFVARWLPERDRELGRQTTPESWTAIVDALNNSTQQKIVTDERESTNVLVLAGPGSGKTRVLVHRIAFLVRVRREHPRGILALAYNRHAAVEIRRRLKQLIGDDARGITVMTCHALAMRLTGESLAEKRQPIDNRYFRDMLKRATALLRGEDLPPAEADEQRDRLLAGFRWILVDEYQDIAREQYELIAAIAGRRLEDESRKLTLFAVGDDDQNIYAFDGASVEFIRRFEQDYSARTAYLVDNYRATGHLIAFANHVIAPAAPRMKAAQPITIDRLRRKDPAGGRWARLDPVGQGRAQCLPSAASPEQQALAVMTELQRLAALDPDWDWADAAVIAREWRFLNPVRAWCELHGVPVQMAREETGHFWRLRETRKLIDWLRERDQPLVQADTIRQWLCGHPATHWWEVLREAIEAYALETGEAEMPQQHFIEWLVEWGRELHRRQRGLLLLTAHRAKGLEFKHVAVLDGHWDRRGKAEDRDAPRRLFYVAVTRAIETLTLGRLQGTHPFLDCLPELDCLQARPDTPINEPEPELSREYRQLTPGDVDLSAAGRRAPGNPIHAAIAALAPGDPIHVRRIQDRWLMLDPQERELGRLAAKFVLPEAQQIVAASVTAVILRDKEDSDLEYHPSLRCERWEVVLPELVLENE